MTTHPPRSFEDVLNEWAEVARSGQPQRGYVRCGDDPDDVREEPDDELRSRLVAWLESESPARENPPTSR